MSSPSVASSFSALVMVPFLCSICCLSLSICRRAFCRSVSFDPISPSRSPMLRARLSISALSALSLSATERYALLRPATMIAPL
jgi:hypothetical protein